MKTLIILLSISAFLSSCASRDATEKVPTVSNRDAGGRFITPACPQCGAAPVRSGTVYQCPNNHVYSSEILPR